MSPQPITENTLFYSDNSGILRAYIPDNKMLPQYGTFKKPPRVRESRPELQAEMF